ncbi:hypothetical protein R83H12_01720 [Fibrobacteria bacterium R8-3-H12]
MNKAKLTSEDVWAMFAETDRRMQETDQQIKKTAAAQEETDRLFKKLGLNVAGISNSNGKFAEELFYDSLESSKTFAGVHFDAVSNVFGGTERMPDGTMLQDQFDIVMINDNAVAIIEIKYKADRDYPKKMAKEKVNNFRVLFPKYSNYKIYLGLGSLVFEKRVVDEAKKHGIGLLKQKGNTIEYKTDWVRAY